MSSKSRKAAAGTALVVGVSVVLGAATWSAWGGGSKPSLGNDLAALWANQYPRRVP